MAGEELPLKAVVSVEVSDAELDRAAQEISKRVTANTGAPAPGSPGGAGAAIPPGLVEATNALNQAIDRMRIPQAPAVPAVPMPAPSQPTPSAPGEPTPGTRPRQAAPASLFDAMQADLRRAITGIGRGVAPNTMRYVEPRVAAAVKAIEAIPKPVMMAGAAAAGAGLLAAALPALAGRRLDRAIGDAAEYSPELTLARITRERGAIERAQLRGSIQGASAVNLSRELNETLRHLTVIGSTIQKNLNDGLAILLDILNGPLSYIAGIFGAVKPNPALVNKVGFDLFMQMAGGSPVKFPSVNPPFRRIIPVRP